MKHKTALIILYLIFLIHYNTLLLGYTLNKSNGTSMCPNLPKNGITFSKHITQYSQLEEGKVYTYRKYLYDKKGIKLIQHRLIKKMDELGMAKFKGDNNDYEEYVDYEDIVYEQIFDIPLIKCKEDDMRDI